MVKIPNSNSIYAIDEKTIYLKGNFLKYIQKGNIDCKSLSYEGLTIIDKSLEGITFKITSSGWYIKEIKNHKLVFSLNQLSYSKFKLYLE
jgi:hypothetical protein